MIFGIEFVLGCAIGLVLLWLLIRWWPWLLLLGIVAGVVVLAIGYPDAALSVLVCALTVALGWWIAQHLPEQIRFRIGRLQRWLGDLRPWQGALLGLTAFWTLMGIGLVVNGLQEADGFLIGVGGTLLGVIALAGVLLIYGHNRMPWLRKRREAVAAQKAAASGGSGLGQ